MYLSVVGYEPEHFCVALVMLEARSRKIVHPRDIAFE
jgi:hypothetical protein